MWLWFFRIICTAATLFCWYKQSSLLTLARYYRLPDVTDDQLYWDMTDKLLNPEGKALASTARLWVIPTMILWIVSGLLWLSK